MFHIPITNSCNSSIASLDNPSIILISFGWFRVAFADQDSLNFPSPRWPWSSVKSLQAALTSGPVQIKVPRLFYNQQPQSTNQSQKVMRPLGRVPNIWILRFPSRLLDPNFPTGLLQTSNVDVICLCVLWSRPETAVHMMCESGFASSSFAENLCLDLLWEPNTRLSRPQSCGLVLSSC